MNPKPTAEAAFECVIDAHLLGSGHSQIVADGLDRQQSVFPDVMLDFIRTTQPNEWAKLEAQHGDKTGEPVLTDLCKWMDSLGCLATLELKNPLSNQTVEHAMKRYHHDRDQREVIFDEAQLPRRRNRHGSEGSASGERAQARCLRATRQSQKQERSNDIRR